MKNSISALTSNRVSLVLLLLFAVSMAVATFIENDFGTPRARTLVYNAWWFELIMIWLCINFMMQIKRFRLLSSGKWAIGLFHLGFIVSIIGAGITRYYGFEGWAHIREGQTISHITSAEPHLQVQQKMGESWQQLISNKADFKGGDFAPETYQTESIEIDLEQFYSRVKPVVRPGNDTLLQVVVATPERVDTWLNYGEWRKIGNATYSFGSKAQADVHFDIEEDSLTVFSPHIMHIQTMSAEMHGALAAMAKANVHIRMVYQFEEAAFMIPAFYAKSELAFEPVANKEDKSAEDYLKISIREAGKSEQIKSFVLKDFYGDSEDWFYFDVQDKTYRLAYGIKSIPLPFSLELTSFELERYPGSQSPSSFASNLVVHDENGHFPYRIFMNNVLDHKGFRFFQASYDNDEKGTVLSVNNDFWGTWITYLGYAMLTVFMILTLFNPKSRFVLLRKKMSASSFKISLILLFLMSSSSLNAQFNPNVQLAISPEISDKVGELVVQDLDGRMKPMNTLALELTRKISGKTQVQIEFLGNEYTLSANQFFLSSQLYSQIWLDIPIIKVGKSIREDIAQHIGKVSPNVLAFNELLTEKGEYSLQKRIEEASQKKPSSQNDADKEYLKLDERFNIFYGLVTGEFFRAFPHKEDPNHTWYTPHHAIEALQPDDAKFAENVFPLLANLIQKNSIETEKEAIELISYVDQFQKIAGKSVYPDAYRLKVELFDNTYSILSNLFFGFISVGFLWLSFSFVNVFKSLTWYKSVHKSGIVLSWLLFLMFTAGMLLRWYIANRPPWTDGFEMLLLASWGIVLMGLITGNKNYFTIPLSVLFTGVLLFVAYLDWLNPEITNLVPVLKSYWLKIHVAVIVLGYAPLALAALLSLMYLVLKAIDPNEEHQKVKNTLKDLSVLAEINITIGLFLLTIGTFLGGIWANESWGRYWGWDPKETWALISIIVYAFVVHLQLVPIKKMSHWFNVASMWAFSSIIMTSFGVNYYLAGLHSYAKGDPVPVPNWVFVLTGVLILLTILSFRKQKKHLS